MLVVILSHSRAIPTAPASFSTRIFNGLRTAYRLLNVRTDEVARNGVLQRITSARGFLWAPLAFSSRHQALPALIPLGKNLRLRFQCSDQPRAWFRGKAAKRRKNKADGATCG